MTKSMTVVVSNAAELKTALVTRGDATTIILKAGNYGDFSFDAKDISIGIKLAAADASKPPIFSTLTIANGNGVSIEGLHFTPNPALKFAAGLTLRGCDGVVVTKNTFDGANGAFETQQRGIVVDKSADVSLLNNDFSGLMRGVVMSSTDGAKLIGNHVHEMRSEGFNFAGVTNVEIAHNKMENFFPKAGDHPDFIQFWTTNMPKATENINIHHNTLTQTAPGLSAQGIFMDNDDHVRYKNIVIDSNVIQSGMGNGINIAEADGVTVINNTAIAVDGALMKVSINVTQSTDAVISGNTSNAMNLTGSKILENIDNIFTGSRVTGFTTLSSNDISDIRAESSFVRGTDSDDRLNGTAHKDVIIGGKGNDVINAGGSDDVISGGEGNDIMSGGAGADQFVFQVSALKTAEVDKIMDFSFGEGDSLKFEGFHTLSSLSGFVEIESMKELADLAHDSDVTISRKGMTDVLIVSVNDGHGAPLQIHLSNQYAAYIQAGGELI